jgi:hypothetical protein
LISVFIDSIKSIMAIALSFGILHRRSAYWWDNHSVIMPIFLSNTNIAIRCIISNNDISCRLH